MDEAVIKYYRAVIKADFPNAGAYDPPSILLDTTGGHIRSICGGGSNYMRVYLKIQDGVIAGIKYHCACDPIANVLVEILCELLKGKTLDEAEAITVDMFLQILGGPSEEFCKRAEVLLGILRGGLEKYRCGIIGNQKEASG